MSVSRRRQRFTSQQWMILLGLLVLLNVVVGGGLYWLLTDDVSPQAAAMRQVVAIAIPTRTPLPTFTPRGKVVARPPVILTPRPTATNTRVPTWTPSVTLTPSPTPTETPAPPTRTPIPHPPTDTPAPPPVSIAVAAAPVAPPLPAPPTATPNVDFTATIRQLTPCENQGNHHIFIYVRNQNGDGIPGVKVRISWSGGEAEAVTGTKIEDDGLTDFAMFKGSYFVNLLGFSSDTVGPISPDIPEDQTCKENGNPVANSLYHYSYEVIFTKVR